MTPAAAACCARLCALALVIGIPAASAANTPAPVRFTLDRGVILIPVRVAGEGPFIFVLDTGSSRSAIAAHLAARLRVPVVARSSVVSWGDSSVRPVVRLPVLAVGDIEKRDMLATVFDSSELRALAGNVDGILGMDFLDRRYALDYRRKLLRWDGRVLEDAQDSVRLRVRWSEGRCLVAVTHGEGEPLWFVADSGTNTVVLFHRADRRALPTLDTGERVALDTAGGRWLADRVLVVALRMGPLTLRHVPAIQMSGRRDETAEGDGLLPLHLFAQVIFDPGSASMMVIPR